MTAGTSFEHRILITGANGFVGKWLQSELKSRQSNHSIDIFPVGHGTTTGKAIDVRDYDQLLISSMDISPLQLSIWQLLRRLQKLTTLHGLPGTLMPLGL
ncbi:hypothetical protein BLM14_19480 (plasmid) [Phyllobacterium zundukense]|uniref:hypothetical protein n=1 Tax=Phyllobacterium zundukense TaxID=1867719 RepID=UPI000C600E30|nr:hypothetical protein [Phyllobacterium zundukense]ATU94513.1 hypothetical protein BLM14_19480 [Phyllobacterium zundukense]